MCWEVVWVRELSVAEQRYQAVLAVIEDGLSVTEAAAKVGVSRQTLHGWLSRYAVAGLEGLADRSHRPRWCPHQMPAGTEVRLVELRGLHPGWGAARLAYRLGREGFDPVPSVAAVGRALRRLGLTGGHRRAGRRAYRRWERGQAMELWQLDVMGGIRLIDGSELKAVTGIDDHSRYCLAFGLVERATSRPVCSVSAAALQAYGVPEEVLTDNGKVFTGRYASRPVEVLFDRICRENGITHRLTAPRSPTTTGKIERFHGTARRELLNATVFDSKAHAQQVIAAWVAEYNHRPAAPVAWTSDAGAAVHHHSRRHRRCRSAAAADHAGRRPRRRGLGYPPGRLQRGHLGGLATGQRRQTPRRRDRRRARAPPAAGDLVRQRPDPQHRP